MRCSVDSVTWRVFLRSRRREPITQSCILQSQISVHVSAVCIASNTPDKRVIKRSSGHFVMSRKHVGVYLRLILDSMKAHGYGKQWSLVDTIPTLIRHARAASSIRTACFLNVYNSRSHMPPAFSTTRWSSLPLLRAFGEDIILTRADLGMWMLMLDVVTDEAQKYARCMFWKRKQCCLEELRCLALP
jgi:hypothetical protein